jgi:hypothetical protein
MGRIIRSERLSTRIVADAMCASACNFAFMGGVIRVVEPGGRFGVHMFSNDSAERLMDDIYRPPKSLDEFNDRYPAIRKKHYQVEELVKTVNEDPKRAGSEPLTIERYLEHPVVKKEVIGTRISEIQMRAAQTSADIAAFLLEMRLPLRFLTTFAHVRAEEIAYLSQQQLRALNIID